MGQSYTCLFNVVGMLFMIYLIFCDTFGKHDSIKHVNYQT